MSHCCSIDTQTRPMALCPACSAPAKAVARATLYQQVCYPDNLCLPAGRFYFCPRPECSLGYFSAAGHRIPKTRLREAAQIEAGWLCYCFDISIAAYREALGNHQAEAIKGFVMTQTRTGACACASRNPSGRCCLAEFKHLEKAIRNEPF